MLAIISDLHDNLANQTKILAWCHAHEVDALVCCGDVTNRETLAAMSEQFTGQIWLALGNGELFTTQDLDKLKNITNLGRNGGLFNWRQHCLVAVHEPDKADLFLKDRPRMIFYGHTHRPWIKKSDTTLLVNPGTGGGIFTPATFAVWNGVSEEPELKILGKIK